MTFRTFTPEVTVPVYPNVSSWRTAVKDKLKKNYDANYSYYSNNGYNTNFLNGLKIVYTKAVTGVNASSTDAELKTKLDEAKAGIKFRTPVHHTDITDDVINALFADLPEREEKRVTIPSRATYSYLSSGYRHNISNNPRRKSGWRSIPDMPTVRSKALGITLDGKIYIMSGSGTENKNTCYDPSTKQMVGQS